MQTPHNTDAATGSTHPSQDHVKHTNEASQSGAQGSHNTSSGNIGGTSNGESQNRQGNTQETTKRAEEAAQKAASQLGEIYAGSGQAVAHAFVDTVRKATDGGKQSFSEIQTLSEQAANIRSIEDLANWQLSLVEHVQRNVSAAVDLYGSLFRSSLDIYKPALQKAPSLAQAANVAA